jgi:microcystin-dependent protein
MAVLLFAILLAGCPGPELTNYQGRIYLEDGSSDVTGSYAIKFFLYYQSTDDVPPTADDDALWGELHPDVQVSRGLFSILLGAGTAIDGVPHGPISEVFKSKSVYIAFQVADEEMALRQRFTSTPQALIAHHAVNAVHGVPPGTVMPFAGGNIPYGWLPCDGSSINRTEYSKLFEAIGTNWGSVDAQSFSTPNLGARIPVGVNASNSLATRRGSETHKLTVAEMPDHKHNLIEKHRGTYDVGDIAEQRAGQGLTSENRYTGSAGGNAAHNNIQPSAVVKYIIKW